MNAATALGYELNELITDLHTKDAPVETVVKATVDFVGRKIDQLHATWMDTLGPRPFEEKVDFLIRAAASHEIQIQMHELGFAQLSAERQAAVTEEREEKEKR
jgi:hypothetical protein